MTTQYINSVISVVAVSDFENSLTWYKKLFGRVPDVVPMEGIVEWEIVGNAWIQLALDPDHAGSSTVVFAVSDIELQRKICSDAGISVGEVVEYPEIVKMIDAVDPEGNRISFVQDISNSSGS